MKWPCFYGIDFATRAELIANGLDVEEIRASPSAPTRWRYISLEGLIEATDAARRHLCRACFTGEYPIELPDAGAARQAPARELEPVVAADADASTAASRDAARRRRRRRPSRTPARP